MRRLLIIVALCCCAGAGPAAGQKDAGQKDAGQKEDRSVDMAAAKKIFIGWVDISLDDWAVLGYEDKQEWSAVIDRNNLVFQRMAQSQLAAQLAGRQITGAKDKSDENTSDQALHVKFSDVRFDVESYRLFLSMHFIDPQSGSELASVPLQGYRGGHFSVDNCMKGALEKVAQKLRQQIQRAGKK